MQVKSIAEREHPAILLTIKLPFVFKTFVLSIFEWPLKKGFITAETHVIFVLLFMNGHIVLHKGLLVMDPPNTLVSEYLFYDSRQHRP